MDEFNYEVGENQIAKIVRLHGNFDKDAQQIVKNHLGVRGYSVYRSQEFMQFTIRSDHIIDDVMNDIIFDIRLNRTYGKFINTLFD